jgi:hypothetical protein
VVAINSLKSTTVVGFADTTDTTRGGAEYEATIA